MCVLMVIAIDNEVCGCYVYKDVWSTGMNSKLPCSPKSATARRGPVRHYTHTLRHTEILT